MIKLIKEIYDAGRQAGFNEAELKFKDVEMEYKDEINILRTIVAEASVVEEIDFEGIEEID